MRLLHDHGALVFFGDISTSHGAALASELPGAEFHRVDMAEYSDLVSLFETAFTSTGRIDGAICCAAIGEPPGLFNAETLTREGLLLERKDDEGGEKKVARVIEVNLTGVVQFSRVALGYINTTTSLAKQQQRQQKGGEVVVEEEKEKEGFTPSITLVSSIAGITPAPGLFTCMCFPLPHTHCPIFSPPFLSLSVR